ncbi:MAG: CpsD/CapB family tyrosine-protein kinase [Pseudomonadota bacterium]
MERIRQAVQKAKEKRAAEGPAPGGPRTPLDPGLRAPGRDGDLDLMWDSLPGFQPDPRHLNRGKVVTFEQKNAAAVSFDKMRTKILAGLRAEGWRRIGITSPMPRCGKTLVAANLAFSFARQPDTRAVLLDFDLRRPQLGPLLGITAPHSVGSVLAGGGVFSDHLLRYGDTLAIGTNAQPVGSASELLQSRAASAAMDTLMAQFDPSIVIVDLPPMLTGDDVMAAMGLVDCVLLIAAAGASTLEQIDECERDLAAGSNVLGVVLNKVEINPDVYSYY